MAVKLIPDTVGERAAKTRMLRARAAKAAKTRKRRLAAKHAAITNAERQAAHRARQVARYTGALRALTSALAKLPARKRGAILESLAPDLRADLDHAAGGYVDPESVPHSLDRREVDEQARGHEVRIDTAREPDRI